MSTTRTSRTSRLRQREATPMIGSLLRLPHEIVVARMLASLTEAGFDVTLAELGVFLYPGPEGRRPSDLARQCNMTRQAMNYVLASLERRDYIERHDGASATMRVVRLADRGWELVAQMRTCLSRIEQE